MEIRTPNNALEWEAYYDLRYRVLRQPWNQSRGSERDDLEAVSFHLACFDGNRIVGVVRLDTLSEEFAQVRFMAVDSTAQGKGLGTLLMKAAEKHAGSKGYAKIVLQARENAIPFYLSMGYKQKEKSHLLFGEIQHWRMEKTRN